MIISGANKVAISLIVSGARKLMNSSSKRSMGSGFGGCGQYIGSMVIGVGVSLDYRMKKVHAESLLVAFVHVFKLEV